ncbi:MAG: 50S ribosomal protein L1 [Candidatus Bathyarchaeota archaeon]|nr:50S ribosomal protein L1 [Candidatus Bathyarchaeota archaeon]
MSIETGKLRAAFKEMREGSKKGNFNQSIELIINLRDLDMKKPEGRIEDKIELPRPLDKKVSVCVFANGDMALRARRGGADLVLEGVEIEGLTNDKKKQRQIAKNMDSFIAAAPLMPLVGRVFGPILGPRGKMPAPVAPTANIEEEIRRHRRMVLIRTRGQPVLQCRVGTEGMSDDEIIENIQAVLTRIVRRLKRGLKNVGSIHIKTTMGPSVKVSI